MGILDGIDTEKVREYARLMVRMGVNVQPGQEIVVNCPVEHYEFCRLLVEEAYKAGAGEVIVRWSDQAQERLYYEYVSDGVLSTVPQWRAESYNYYSRRGAGQISVTGNDPEGFKGIDPGKLRRRSAAMDKALEEHYRLLMASKIPWTVAAVPQKNWARKVFPELGGDEAVKMLWERIFEAVRIGGGDAVEKWRKHDGILKEKCRKMNGYAFEKLHYKNNIGTDFTVGLVKNHIWEGGSEISSGGTVFEANMPTEEIFTMPDRRKAEGVLVGAMPLSYQGNLIRGFSLTFREGRVVDYRAEEGADVLKQLLESDEGSGRLGEVALVPASSPISRMKTLFYNTLFDENASCHFALGDCYPTTVKGGAEMSAAELAKAGGNSSMNHVDFMVGTQDLSVTGIREDGTEVAVFENGDWAAGM